MICPNCHSENRDGAKFCNECGRSLVLDGVGHLHDDSELSDFTDVDAGSAANVTQLIPAVSASAGKTTVLAPGENRIPSASPDALSAAKTQLIPEVPSGAETQVISQVSPAGATQVIGSDAVAAKTQVVSDASKAFGQAAPIESLPQIDEAPEEDLFSGFERMTDSSYAPVQRSWNPGNTMELPKIESDGSVDYSTSRSISAPDPKAKTKGNKGKVAAVVVAVLAVCALAAVGVTYYLELWGGKVVPNVSGDAQNDAQWILESKGFKVATVQVKSDEAEGMVLLTDPVAGSRKDEGSTITLSIATPRSVPEIIGMSQEDAQQRLADEGLTNVSFVTEKSNETEGSVIATSLDAGSKVKAGTALTVTVAEAYTVPDVTGKSEDAATGILEAAGYSVSVAWVYSEDMKEGTAMSTEPAAGEKYNTGQSVTLKVAKSRASELVSETRDFFSGGPTVSLDGVSYEVSSCDAVSYQGDSTTSYTITARVVETVETVFFGSQTMYGSWQSISGTITWNSNNAIVSSDPVLKK